MATKRFNVKLPKFKLTKRSTTGQVSHQVVPLGCLERESKTALESPLEPPAPSSGPPVFSGNEATSDDQSFPSLHHIMQKQTAESWGKIRASMLNIATESEAMPIGEKCYLCKVAEASYRCLQCSSVVFYCPECFSTAHSKTNLFHKAEIWEVSTSLTTFYQ